MFDTVLKSAGLFLSRNSTTILTSVAVAGVISTAVLAVRGTPGAMYAVDKLDNEEPDHTKLDLIKVVVPHYIPALATGGVTIACVIAANRIGMRRSAALASAYTLMDHTFTDYRKKIADTFGEAKAQKAHDELVDDRIKLNPPSELYLLEADEVMCYEVLTGRYFKSTPEKIRRAQNTLNGRMLDGVEYGVSLNEFYLLCDIPTTLMGEEMGWNTDARIDIQLSSHLTDGDKPCLAISYNMPPFPKFYSLNKRDWA
jgi:hypothetical protein